MCLMAGFSLIEACASGRPVISYDVEWHRELVKDGETGFLIKEHDLDSLCKAVIYLLDHPSVADSLGKSARNLAFQNHDVKNVSKIKNCLYKELILKGKK